MKLHWQSAAASHDLLPIPGAQAVKAMPIRAPMRSAAGRRAQAEDGERMPCHRSSGRHHQSESGNIIQADACHAASKGWASLHDVLLVAW